MKLNSARPQSTPMPGALKLQRTLLALCILLAPISITVYLLPWSGDLRHPLVASALASLAGNTWHLIGGVAASFFLLTGYLGMSLLGMRRSPGLATLSAAFSIIGWIPWSALIGLDDLAYAMQSDDQSVIAGARSHALAFTNVFTEKGFSGYIDLGNFVQLLQSESGDENVQKLSGDVLAGVKQAVIAEKHGSGKQGATGVAIYFPNSSLYKSPYSGPQYG